MKGKLIKTEVNYLLEGEGGVVIASTSLKKEGMSLSIKNCQVIERGYDLDELAKIEYPICEVWNDEEALIRELAFKKGFQKALEILGDKKFSEDDMHKALHLMNNRTRIPISGEALDIIAKIEKQRNEIIQSLQQTQWDVEVEMICPHPSDTYRCGIQYGCDEDGCNHPNQVPYLDGDGCLILKRI